MDNSANPKQIVEDGYNRAALDYARLEGDVKWPRMRWLRKLLGLLEPGASVLDLGCGSGVPADIEIAKQHKVIGIDISQAQIELACRNVPGGSFIRADAGTIELPEATFDAVVSFYTIEHLPREEHAVLLGRIHRWLKTSGYLLISMEAADCPGIYGKWLGVPMFMSCYDPDTMRQMIQMAGFELLETAIEAQVEGSKEIPYLWVIGQKK